MAFVKSRLAVWLVAVQSVLASVTLDDPSNVIPPSEWASDNTITANYNIAFIDVQPSPIYAALSFDGADNSTSLSHETFTVDANDTSVISVAEGAELGLSFVDVIKYGYSSNLNYASFYGINAAINVANASTASFDHINVTVHNGAANIYSYGSDTIVNVSNAWLYSSGPVSHGLYASGNGTIYGTNINHFSGGTRSSSFSGDSPKGTIYISDSVAHTQGIGSATFYALGSIYADNVVGLTENAPVAFMDGAQSLSLTNCECTAGLLGGMMIFSSSDRISGASIKISDSKITATGSTMPGLWFGNVIADVELYSAELETASGVLIVANYSQVTQDFDYYADYSDNSALSPAEVYLTVSESTLTGDLVPYNESYISWNLTEYSSWTGATYSGYGTAYTDVALDASSNWTLTADSYVQNLTDTDATAANINSNGYTLYYNSGASLNGWLANRTIALSGGGSITPSTDS